MPFTRPAATAHSAPLPAVMSLAVTVAALAIGFLASIGGMAAFVQALRASGQLMRHEILEWIRVGRGHSQHRDDMAGAGVASPARSVPEADARGDDRGEQQPSVAVVPSSAVVQTIMDASHRLGWCTVPVDVQCNGTTKGTDTIFFAQFPARTVHMPVSMYTKGIAVPSVDPVEANANYKGRVSLMVGVDFDEGDRGRIFTKEQAEMNVVCIAIGLPVNFTVQIIAVEPSPDRGFMPVGVALNPELADQAALAGFRDGTDMTSMSAKWWGVDESALNHLSELNSALRDIGALHVTPGRFAALCDIVCGGSPWCDDESKNSDGTKKWADSEHLAQWNIHDLQQLVQVGWLEDHHIETYRALCTMMGEPIRETP